MNVASTYPVLMANKIRLSATIDADVLAAAEAAVARGRFDSVSAWVNEALRERAEHDRRLDAGAKFIDAYEAEHGAIAPEEARLADRRAKARAIRTRDLRSPERKRTRRR